jgi:2,4-dienoyl-CoA reductase-like NADH-dependent reductase (Old Yellow Enzyme family)
MSPTSTTAKLFTPLQLRELEFKNRIFVSPMCQYSATDGVPNTWHLVHLGSRAVGGAALVMAEATGVNAVGRISPGDLGLWNQEQMKAFQPITQFIKDQGAVPAIQLAHAGRKASTSAPWSGDGPLPVAKGGWVPVGPEAVPFTEKHNVPKALTSQEIAGLVKDFEVATKLSLEAGFQVVEIHMAHGYLMHEFLSPLTNHRSDEFGGSLENRMRFPLQVVEVVRRAWPAKWPVFVRLSASDWVEGGWDLPQSIELSKKLKALGVDLIDCSSGGAVPDAKIPAGPGYQVPFAAGIRAGAGIATGAVGIITTAVFAEKVLNEGQADVIFLARELLRDPYFPLHAARDLGVEIPWPVQYERAKRSH